MPRARIAGSPFAVSDRLIRLSVGVEADEGLVEDLAAALR
jgi:cystathionine beta-lyase/cystathionine gamma-synthase